MTHRHKAFVILYIMGISKAPVPVRRKLRQQNGGFLFRLSVISQCSAASRKERLPAALLA